MLWIKIIAAALLAAAVAWAVHAYNEHFRDQGRAEVTAKYAKRDADAVIEQAREKAAHDAAVKKVEQGAQDGAVAAAKTYQDNLRRIEREKTAAIANAATRGLFLHSACPSSEPAGLPGRADAGRSANAAGRAELPSQDAGFLLSEAGRADQYAAQINGLQELVRTYVGVCGPK